MTKLRKAWLAVAVAAVITTMTGLAPAASAAPQESKKIARIGLMVQDMSNPFFSAMERNAKQAAAKIGATLNVQDAQVDLANQNTQIDAFIQQKVDLIIISAVDESGIEPAIQRAKAAGIIVIAVDTPAKGADAAIMTNAIQAGETSCEYLFSQMGGKGKVLLVDGTPIQTIIDRIKGCKNVAQKYALGAVLAVEQAGKAGAINVTGVDGSPEAVEELKRGGSPFIGTATQNPGEMVRQAISLAQDMVDGKPIASRTVLIPSVLVTRDNVGSYPGW